MNRGVLVAEITDQDVDDIYAARAALELAGAEALMSHRVAALVSDTSTGC